jgi:DNA transposition AAA+ family ATPase
MNNYKGWLNVETLQSKEILAELNDAKNNKAAKLIISDTGLGKTNTIKLFKKVHNAGTFVITVGDSYKLGDVLDALLEQLGITTYRTSITARNKMQLIVDKMKELSTSLNCVIIIDEAENLKPNILRMMKELYDHVIEYSSLVLIGTEQILETIHNRRRRNRTGVPQLWRRFKAGTRYVSSLKKDRDFAPFFKTYIPTETGLQKLLVQYAENYGELHDYLEPVLRFAAAKGQPVTEDLFRVIHKISK